MSRRAHDREIVRQVNARGLKVVEAWCEAQPHPWRCHGVFVRPCEMDMACVVLVSDTRRQCLSLCIPLGIQAQDIEAVVSAKLQEMTRRLAERGERHAQTL